MMQPVPQSLKPYQKITLDLFNIEDRFQHFHVMMNTCTQEGRAMTNTARAADTVQSQSMRYAARQVPSVIHARSLSDSRASDSSVARITS